MDSSSSSQTSSESDNPGLPIETDHGATSVQVSQSPSTQQGGDSSVPSIGPIEENIATQPAEQPHLPQEDIPDKGAEKIASTAQGNGNEGCCPSTGRNICVSSDGTLGAFGEKNSNVVELQSRIIKDKYQSSYYISGIGTYGESDIRRWWDAAVASSFERNVLEAYKWLCDTYKPGDRIFLFGFSRGAYQVRVIAGMIQLVGLLYRGNHAQIPYAFKLYMKTMEESQKGSDRKKEPGATKEAYAKEESDTKEEPHSKDGRNVMGEQKTTTEQKGKDEQTTKATQNTKGHKKAGKKKPNVAQQCQTFKKAFSQPDVKVHFVGAWDTVSSVGFIRRPCLPETTSGMQHVCHFRQALALDERRVKFWPEYANTKTSPPGSGSTLGGGDVKEVWFAGSHSDIGGWSYANENLDSFGPALRWMTYEAMNHGLRMRPHTKLWEPVTPKPSLTWGWKILEYLPLLRPSNKHETTRRPHMGAPRHIQSTQLIHESVFETMGIPINDIQNNLPSSSGTPLASDSNSRGGRPKQFKFHSYSRITSMVALLIHQMRPRRSESLTSTGDVYKPSARFYDGNTTWDEIVSLKERREDDPFASATSAVLKLKEAIEFNSDNAAFDAAIQALENHVLLPKNKDTQTGRPLAPYSKGDGLKALAEVSTDASLTLSLALRREVERQERPRRSDVLTTLLVALAAAPPDERVQLAGVIFQTVATIVKDDISRKSYWKIVRHYGIILLDRLKVDDLAMSIAFSSNSEELAIIGTPGGVASWDRQAETSSPVTVMSVDVWRGSHNVHISKDGSRCVIGYQDGAVEMWHVGTSQGRLLHRLSPEEDADFVNAVAFSSDNSKIAYGSRAGALRIWDINTQADAHGQMTGHTGEINMVAFSSDGSLLVSGADDCTVRLWDATNGKALQVMEGHKELVYSVAFSPFNKQVISASFDDTVCIWDVASGNLKTKLEGHIWARCAIFSPSGKFVASGDGRTVRLWDPISGERLIAYDVEGAVLSLTFSADGKKLMSGTSACVYIWDTSFLL